jgi:hypothetical protein
MPLADAVSAGFVSAGFVSAGFVSAGFVSAGFVSAGFVSADFVSAEAGVVVDSCLGLLEDPHAVSAADASSVIASVWMCFRFILTTVKTGAL